MVEVALRCMVLQFGTATVMMTRIWTICPVPRMYFIQNSLDVQNVTQLAIQPR